MANPFFHFKQFTIHQDRVAMKVGTDGVLLGAWTDVSGCQTILDVGTGTGLLALMMAQRQPMATIHAVEISEEAAHQANENFKASPWKERIHLFPVSLQDFSRQCPTKYDLIICNPPFFENSLKAPDQHRRLARHADELPFELLIREAYALILQDGRFAVILPVNEAIQFQELAQNNGLFLNRTLHVYPKPDCLPKRVLMEFRKIMPTETITENLIIESTGRHGYSEEYKTLTRDFYLNL
jgi:tRNA1Val (adenine37-N6)-methyltransferase